MREERGKRGRFFKGRELEELVNVPAKGTWLFLVDISKGMCNDVASEKR